MTGQKMAEYPDEGGEFLRIAREILDARTLVRWYKDGVAIRRAQEYAAMPAAEVPPVVAALAASMPTISVGEGDAPAKPVAAPSKVSSGVPGAGMGKARIVADLREVLRRRRRGRSAGNQRHVSPGKDRWVSAQPERGGRALP